MDPSSHIKSRQSSARPSQAKDISDALCSQKISGFTIPRIARWSSQIEICTCHVDFTTCAKHQLEFKDIEVCELLDYDKLPHQNEAKGYSSTALPRLCFLPSHWDITRIISCTFDQIPSSHSSHLFNHVYISMFPMQNPKMSWQSSYKYFV